MILSTSDEKNNKRPLIGMKIIFEPEFAKLDMAFKFIYEII